MEITRRLIEFDNLSIKIFSGLIENVLTNISSSAGTMLDVACLFFDKDVSAALLNFQKLYLQHAKLDKHKDTINKQVYEILVAAQDADATDTVLHELDTANNDSDDLVNIQKDLEALIQQDAHIKRRMIPVMQCMQYEDLVTNRVQRLVMCWEYMISLLDSTVDVDLTTALQKFDGFLASVDEHEKFYKHVLHIDYQHCEDLENHQIGELEHDIDTVHTLLSRLFEFSQDSLNNCISQTQNTFEELMTLLNLVSGDSEDVAYLFSDKEETLGDIQNILVKFKDGTHAEVGKLIKEIEVTKAKHSDEASTLIQSFMMALQSQDRIRQNMGNIGHFHHLLAHVPYQLQ